MLSAPVNSSQIYGSINIYVNNSRTNLYALPVMVMGSMPIDGGGLIIKSFEEYIDIVN